MQRLKRARSDMDDCVCMNEAKKSHVMTNSDSYFLGKNDVSPLPFADQRRHHDDIHHHIYSDPHSTEFINEFHNDITLPISSPLSGNLLLFT